MRNHLVFAMLLCAMVTVTPVNGFCIQDKVSSPMASTPNETLQKIESQIAPLRKRLFEVQSSLNLVTDGNNPNYNPNEARRLAEAEFKLSQELFQIEADRLREKLKSIDDTISNRQANQQRIIESNMLTWVKVSPLDESLSNTPVKRPLAKIASSDLAEDLRFVERTRDIAAALRYRRTVWMQAREQMIPHERLIKLYSRSIEELKAEGVVSRDTDQQELEKQIARSKPVRDSWLPKAEKVLKEWQQEWNSYKGQLALVESNVQLAKVNLEQSKKLELTLGPNHPRAITEQPTIRIEELKLQKALDIEKAFKSIVEIEPELDPDKVNRLEQRK